MLGIDLQGETEQSLVAALRQGRQEMLGKLYDAYAPILMGVITRIVHQTDVAEQVLQETFIAIWSRIDAYDAAKARLLTWILTIAREISFEAVKRTKNSGSADTANADAKTTSERNKPLPLHSRKEIEQERFRLDPQEKAVLDLLYYKGRTCAETASELNIPVTTLKAVLIKAFTHLKAEKSA